MTYLEELEQKLQATKSGILMADMPNGEVIFLQKAEDTSYDILIMWGVIGLYGAKSDKFYYEDFVISKNLDDAIERAEKRGFPVEIIKDVPLEDWKEVEKI